ncbi:MAG TPA: ABC transporter substrate-binding protein [Acidimicrobiia bacterium]|nr:ABC transporter substrate-binding protein [Acidimicrobiia bacterium]
MTIRGGARLGALLLAFVLLAAACGDDDGADGGELDHISLQMKFSPTVGWAPYLYGIDAGIFEEHGIDLELLSAPGDTVAHQQIAENNVQFAQSDMTSYLNFKATENPPTTAVMVVNRVPRVGILTTLPADSLDDLVGETVAHNPWDLFQFVLPILLDLEGLPTDAVGLEPVVLTNTMLFEGQIDAVMAYIGGTLRAGLIEAEDRGIPVSFLAASDFGFVGYDDVIIVRDEVIRDNPDLVRRFVAALAESVEEARQADDELIVDLLAEQIPAIDRETQMLAWQDVKNLFGGDWRFEIDDVAAMLGYVRDGLGVETDLQPENTFTHDFLP